MLKTASLKLFKGKKQVYIALIMETVTITHHVNAKLQVPVEVKSVMCTSSTTNNFNNLENKI